MDPNCYLPNNLLLYEEPFHQSSLGAVVCKRVLLFIIFPPPCGSLRSDTPNIHHLFRGIARNASNPYSQAVHERYTPITAISLANSTPNTMRRFFNTCLTLYESWGVFQKDFRNFYCIPVIGFVSL
jgi:hypothetical protein